jgi:hypothetical protein
MWGIRPSSARRRLWSTDHGRRFASRHRMCRIAPLPRDSLFPLSLAAVAYATMAAFLRPANCAEWHIDRDQGPPYAECGSRSSDGFLGSKKPRPTETPGGASSFDGDRFLRILQPALAAVPHFRVSRVAVARRHSKRPRPVNEKRRAGLRSTWCPGPARGRGVSGARRLAGGTASANHSSGSGVLFQVS